MYLFDGETRDWIIKKLESNDCKVDPGSFISVITVSNIRFVFSVSGDFVKFLDTKVPIKDSLFKLNGKYKLQKDLSDALSKVIEGKYEKSTQEKTKNLINFD